MTAPREAPAAREEYGKPLPQPTDVSQPFWEGARAGELRIQRCRDCRQHVFYPRSMCPLCLSERLEWVTASGRGKVYSYTVIRRAMHPGFQADLPYVLAIVELEEGPRLTTNIMAAEPEDVSIDMAVEAVFEDVTPEVTLVKFRPSEAK
ncbi:MAG: Zn-ribbon domain-containing OB-fold protein [Chloroflexi bacterium]|nr:Zn-ribbon domain-containing OB-fold protein [Chloroflexota bacterium]